VGRYYGLDTGESFIGDVIEVDALIAESEAPENSDAGFRSRAVSAKLVGGHNTR
jgi:hypothetical protein